MKKIKRFVVNVLSPGEMRHINGGGTPGCLSDACYVYEKYTDKFLYAGKCGGGYDSQGYAVCSCNTSGGSFPGDGACDDN